MHELKLNFYLQTFENVNSYPLSDWSIVPKICAGVYTIW